MQSVSEPGSADGANQRRSTLAVDITYIRLRDEFVFLAVILDAHSRRVIGWALDRTMEDDLTLTALRMALSRRTVEPGLVHHSDRGSQYASGDYTLRAIGEHFGLHYATVSRIVRTRASANVAIQDLPP